MKIADCAFTVFDFETTGLYPYAGDRICEIGAVRMKRGGGRPAKFHTLVNPGRPISPGAFAVNGITDEMVRGKPSIAEALPGFLRFIEGSVLVAYNAGFDLGFLECALAEQGSAIGDIVVIDALRLARRLFPGIGRYSLGSVSRSLDIEPDGEHRALADAILTWKVFKRQLSMIAEEGIDTIEGIQSVITRKARAAAPARDGVLAALEAAIERRSELAITYRSSWNDRTTTRTISPRKIQMGYDRSYVIAHCHLRNEERIFRLDSIIDVKAVAARAGK